MCIRDSLHRGAVETVPDGGAHVGGDGRPGTAGACGQRDEPAGRAPRVAVAADLDVVAGLPVRGQAGSPSPSDMSSSPASSSSSNWAKSVGGSLRCSSENTDQATPIRGTAMTAPRMPATSVPAVTPSAITTGCSETCRPITIGCRTCPSNWPINAIPAPTRIALTGPLAASATTMAMTIANGAPTSGMNAPMNTSTASGAASGTPRISRMIIASRASDAATMKVPRVYPENVYQAAPPPRNQDSRDRVGSWLRNHSHISVPRSRKNTVKKVARANVANASPTEPALAHAWDAMAPLFCETHCWPDASQFWTSKAVTVRCSGDFARAVSYTHLTL